MKQIMLNRRKGNSRPINNRTNTDSKAKGLPPFPLQNLHKLGQPLYGINQKPLINEPARDGNILRSLQLVPSQHDKLDPCLS